jgi:hypothetical protein
MAPQAIVMNRNGIIGGAPSGIRFTTGAFTVGCSTTSPSVSRVSAVMSWCALR